MLVSLGHAVYVEDFESHFLAATAEFYRKEAAELIVSSDCPQYMRLAERRLGEEVERCGHYLDASSEARVTRVVEAELIVGQMRPLVDMEQSGLLPLLQDDKCDDLARMYRWVGGLSGVK